MGALSDRTWALLRPYAKKRAGALCVVLLFGVITSLAQAAMLLLIVPVWNLLFPDPAAAGVAPALEDPDLFERLRSWAEASSFDDPRVGVLVAVCSIAFALGLIAAGSQWAFTWLSRRTSYRMIVDLRVDIARHLMNLSLRYHGARRLGDLLSRVSSDVSTVLETVNVGMKGLVLDPLMALALVVMLLVQAPLPTLILLLILPLAIWPVSKLFGRVRRGSKKSLTSLGASVQSLTQMFQGVRTVKSFGGEEREIERYRALNDKYLESSMKMVRAIALSHGWAAFYSIAGVALLTLVFGLLKLHLGWFQNGGLMASFLLGLGRINHFVKDVTKAWTKVAESVGAAESQQDLLDEPLDVAESPDPRPIAAFQRGIRFEDLGFHYPGGETHALRELSLEIRPGETLALVGPSGAGKSTLVDLVARFIDPTEGRITVDGVDLRELRRRDWTALYAMVGQVPFLFHSSIRENIAYGKPTANDAEIEAAARAAHIHEFIVGLPRGYDTDVADMGSRLSGGQRQRITIARALLKGAPLLLLDEATSALDSESEAEVQRALEELMAHRTVVVIAHRLATVQKADRIAVLDRGRLVELGKHADLIAKKGLYARLYELQKLGIPESEAAVQDA